MALPRALFDVSWSVQFVPGAKGSYKDLRRLLRPARTGNVADNLDELGQDCLASLQSQTRAEPTDELNDESDKTGQLRECVISKLQASSEAGTSWPEGLSINTQYQRTTYSIVLIARRRVDDEKCPTLLILYKASQRHLRHIKNWLDQTFSLPASEALDIASGSLAHICSSYMLRLTPSQAVSEDQRALQLSMIRQVVGNFKISLTMSGAAASQIAPHLRTIEIALPAETVDTLLRKVQADHGARATRENAFLGWLSKAITEKTGLKLPLTPAVVQDSEDGAEPPMKITKITCAAFAISVEGRLKLASKPIEHAEAIGYSENVVWAAYEVLLQMLAEIAERRADTYGS